MGSNFLKYGPQGRDAVGQQNVCATGNYFHRLGGHFVSMEANGVTLIATYSKAVLGWAEVPKFDAGKNSWKSSTTDGAGRSKVFVVTGRDAVFAMPATETTASLAASLVGDQVDLIVTGATYARIQSVLIGRSTGTQLTIDDVDLVNRIAYVRVLTYQND
jgi:hypothetical protein